MSDRDFPLMFILMASLSSLVVYLCAAAQHLAIN